MKFGHRTVYSGTTFRSRLEARWAIAFDSMGLRWKYEPELFRLPSGAYMPDFLVHGIGYVEIKPVHPDADELARLSQLFHHLGDKVDVMCFWGSMTEFARSDYWCRGDSCGVLVYTECFQPDDCRWFSACASCGVVAVSHKGYPPCRCRCICPIRRIESVEPSSRWADAFARAAGFWSSAS